MKSLIHNLPRVFALCAVSLASVLSTAAAQDSGSPMISTDRPTVGASPDLIPKGSFQMESGAGANFQKAQCAFDLPQNFVRIGLSDRLEFRLQTSDVVFQPMESTEARRLANADAAVSAKFLVGRANSLSPKAAILALSLPTGGAILTTHSFDPSLTYIWTQTLRKGYFVNEVAQATVSTFARARRATWAPGIAAGRSFSKQIAAFAEYAPSFLPDHTLSYVVDGGITYAFGKFQQIDARSGYFRDANGLHTLVSFGYSIRRDHFLGKEMFHHPMKAFN